MAVASFPEKIGELKLQLAEELDSRILEKLCVICNLKPATVDDINGSDHRTLRFLNYLQQTTAEDKEFIEKLENLFSKLERPRLTEIVKAFKASFGECTGVSNKLLDFNSMHSTGGDDEEEYFLCNETLETESRLGVSNKLLDKKSMHSTEQDDGEEYFLCNETLETECRLEITPDSFQEYGDQVGPMRSREFDQLKEKIGLTNWTEQKSITLSDVLRLKPSDFSPTEVVDASNLIAVFFSRLMSSDYRSVTVFKTICQTHERQGVVELSRDRNWLKALHSANTNLPHKQAPQLVNCRDSIAAILHSCDDFLRQQLFSKMSACQLAVPLLLPDISNLDVKFLLWELKQVTKTWKEGSETLEKAVTIYPFSTVAIIRLGDLNISKSHIFNTILGQLQQNCHHSYFISAHEDGSPAFLSKGTVETVWFVPEKKTLPNEFRLSRPTCFLNLRGSSLPDVTTKQEKFIFEYASCIVAFIEESKATNYDTKIEEMKKQCYVILVVTSNDSIAHNIRPATQTFDGLTMLLCKGCSTLLIAEEISILLRNIQYREKLLTLSKDGTTLCEKFQIENSLLSNNCSVTEITVKKIFNSIEYEDPKSFKKRVFTLQPHWKKWTQFFKDRTYKESGSEHEIDKYFKDMLAERTKQFQAPLCPEMKTFCEALICLPLKELQFLIQWITIYSNEWVLKTHKPLIQKMMSIKNDVERRKISLQLAEHSFGVEFFFREIGQMYECRTDLIARGRKIQREHDPSLKEITSKVAELFLSGMSLEIFDGDVSNIPLEWIQNVLKELKRKVGNARILTISVLGMQSSGKSTLLNNLFGVNFRVASGRCTRGISIQLLEIDRTLRKSLKCEFLILIDTEGLGSPEKSQRERQLLDNELATFSICLSDLTLINIRGEYIGKELSNILQIAAHAFIRMNTIKLEPSCMIIQQTVSDPRAYEKNFNNEQLIFRELDAAVVVAAKYEHKSDQFKRFNDIFNVTRGQVYDYHIHYIPCLSQGSMDPPNCGYSDKVMTLKSKILHFLSRRQYCQFLDDFALRIKDLWISVIQEDFVFSFRNSTEAVEYREFSALYHRWILEVRYFFMQWELEEDQNIETSTAEEVQTKFGEVMGKLSKIVEEEKNTLQAKIEQYINDSHYTFTRDFKTGFERNLDWFINDTKRQIQENLRRTLHMVLNAKTKNKKLVPQIKAELLENVLSVAKGMTKKFKTTSHTERQMEQAIEQEFEKIWVEFIDRLEMRTEIMTKEVIEKTIKTKISSSVSQNLVKVKKRQLADSRLSKDLSEYHCPLNLPRIPNMATSMGKRKESTNNLLERFKFVFNKQQSTCKDRCKILLATQTENEKCSSSSDFVRKSLIKVPDDTLNELVKKHSYELSKARPKIRLDLSLLDSCKVGETSTSHLEINAICLKFQHFRIELKVENEDEGSPVDVTRTHEFLKNYYVNLDRFNYQREEVVDVFISFIKELIDGCQNDESFDIGSTMTCILSSIIFYLQEMVRSHYLYQIMKCSDCYRAVFAEKLMLEQDFQHSIQNHSNCQQIKNWSILPSKYCFDRDAFYDECSKELEKVKVSWKSPQSEYENVIQEYVRFVKSKKKEKKGGSHENEFEMFLYNRLAINLRMQFLENSYQKWVNKVEGSCEEKLWNIRDIKDTFFDLLKSSVSYFPFDLIDERAVVDRKFSRLPWEIPEIQDLDIGLISNLTTTDSRSYKFILENLSQQKEIFLSYLKESGKFNALNFESSIQDLTSCLQRGNQESLDVSVTLLHFSAWALPRCVETDVIYEKENNIIALLNKERDKIFEEFKDACSNRYDDHRHANELFSLLFPYLQTVAKNKICVKLFQKLLGFEVFHCRRQLIAEILRDLCINAKFEEYLRFLNHKKDFFNDWALKFICKQCLNNKVSIGDIATDILEDLFAEIKQCLKDTIVDKNVQEANSSKTCIQNFLKSLSKNVKIKCDRDLSHYYCQSIKMHNPDHFVKHCVDLLQNNKETLLSNIALNDIKEETTLIKWLKNLPFLLHIELISQVSGCKEQCPFCKASCDKTVDHDIHFCELHYPIGLAGFRKRDDDNTLVEASCSSRIASSRSYNFGRPNELSKSFKRYKEEFPDWDIKPQYEEQPTLYWKWVLTTFNEQFAQQYDAKLAKIPDGWKDISKKSALLSINKTYGVTDFDPNMPDI